MRLHKIYIEEFKNLRRFEMDFDKESRFCILVGQNGAGKSNLLEAIVLVFRNLDLGEPPPFAYRLTYECRNKIIALDADPTRVGRDMVRATGVDGVLFKLDPAIHLPGYVFGYYSGPSHRMEEHFIKHQRKFYKALLRGEDRPMRRLFYAQALHGQFVLLAFYLRTDDKLQAFLRDHLRIEGLDSVLFVLHKPDWADAKSEGLPDFWHATGTVRALLDRLYARALAPLRLETSAVTSFRKQSAKIEHVYLYLPEQECLSQLAASYSSAPEFFKALESTYISDLLGEARANVSVKGVDGAITFRELSEGEQQLLMVLGLLRFTREEESLFLLDEPDTHLNPRWSIEYIDLLDKIAESDASCQLLISTHNPMVVSALTRQQVRIMHRADADGRVATSIPEDDPKGMGIAGILTSDLYGLRAALDIESLGLLDQSRELALKDKEVGLSPEEREKLTQLQAQIHGLDFTRSVRDPLYRPFVEAMTRYDREERERRPAAPPVGSEDERRRRREHALEIVRKLKARGDKEGGE
jgi:predicted ATPase